ncbi:MAG: TIGR01459 family HAD-type hydrolase [Hyphomicrobium sp.]
MPVSEIPIVTSIAPLAGGHDAWLADIWGVMHNGVAPFAAACDACTRFRLAGGVVVLLSNAPRPAASVATQLDRIGVPRFAYDAIVSSGDAARAFIADLGPAQVFHLGPERDLGIYDGLDVRLTPRDTDATAVVCTGLFDDDIETPGDYADLLRGWAARGIPMICANPDLTVERGGKLVYCAGAVAASFAAFGGTVEYAGKPHLPVYDMAFGVIAGLKGGMVEKKRILAIGDGVGTDILGAANAGLASVYVASSVAMRPGESLGGASLARLFPDPAVQPIAATATLAW